jgi:hypothetical protein
MSLTQCGHVRSRDYHDDSDEAFGFSARDRRYGIATRIFASKVRVVGRSVAHRESSPPSSNYKDPADMTSSSASAVYRGLSLPERQRLFLDILTSPSFADTAGWGARFHAWLEEQAADGRSLGEIARRIDLPRSSEDSGADPWQLLNEHVAWMIEQGHARVVRIEIIA